MEWTLNCSRFPHAQGKGRNIKLSQFPQRTWKFPWLNKSEQNKERKSGLIEPSTNLRTSHSTQQDLHLMQIHANFQHALFTFCTKCSEIQHGHPIKTASQPNSPKAKTAKAASPTKHTNCTSAPSPNATGPATERKTYRILPVSGPSPNAAGSATERKTFKHGTGWSENWAHLKRTTRPPQPDAHTPLLEQHGRKTHRSSKSGTATRQLLQKTNPGQHQLRHTSSPTSQELCSFWSIHQQGSGHQTNEQGRAYAYDEDAECNEHAVPCAWRGATTPPWCWCLLQLLHRYTNEDPKTQWSQVASQEGQEESHLGSFESACR